MTAGPSIVAPIASETLGDASVGDHATLALRLAGWLHDDDIDAAIENGLMAFPPRSPDADEPPDLRQACVDIATAQVRLRSAWAARARFHERAARLQRRSAIRDVRKADAMVSTPDAAGKTSGLPPAAAAALARAKARAARTP